MKSKPLQKSRHPPPLTPSSKTISKAKSSVSTSAKSVKGVKEENKKRKETCQLKNSKNPQM
jgi:hypothetical protein